MLAYRPLSNCSLLSRVIHSGVGILGSSFYNYLGNMQEHELIMSEEEEEEGDIMKLLKHTFST